MKKIKFLVLFLVLLITHNFAEVHQREISKEKKPLSPGSKIISKFKYPPLSWQVPKAGKDLERIVLDNGMIIYLKEDHSLPLITLKAIIRTGNIYEKKEKYGVAELTGEVMRMGGTKSYAPEELNKELEYIGASLETSIGVENGSAYLNLLSKDFDKGLNLFSEVLMYPAFDQAQLNLAKSQIKESLRRKNDDPSGISSREFLRAIYEEHPYGRELDWKVVKEITREDLINFHKIYFHPNNIYLAICGDFNKKEVLEKIKRVFGIWEKGELNFPEIPQVKLNFKKEVNIIQKEQNQTYILLGHLGIKRNNPDQYALLLMDYILGGSAFSSRLMSKVRSDEGLAYSVGSHFETLSSDYGNFTAWCETKTETTHKAVELMLKEIEKIKKGPVSNEELKLAKDSFINNFIFGFKNPMGIVSKLMFLEYDRMPLDYYETFLSKIKAVSKEDILKAAQKYLHPDKIIFVLVGDEKKFDKT
ncbi:MAG: insulinase family protein, partial [Armatimonadetes bacterium]|nr:insulinase family protein [Armatimonadota bacterium]